MEQQQETPEQVAARLGSQIGEEAGPSILKLSRAALLEHATRPGVNTSEFGITAILLLGGVAMIVAGHYLGDASLQAEGAELLKWIGAGYVASRGVAKLGARNAAAD